MLAPIKIANFLAKYSCSRWNSVRALRVICRYCYRGLAEIDSKVHRHTNSSIGVSNTYPWPYCDDRFAAWQETRGTLVSDPAGMVIKYATSYCAWKIKETTGNWPTRPVLARNSRHAAEIAKRERPHDARYWREFLAAQGYRGAYEVPRDGHNYVGVNSDYGEYGLVVWFESRADADPASAIVSSYVDKRFWRGQVLLRDFIWIRIEKVESCP